MRDIDSGEPDGYVAISRDVTAGRTMEAKLAELAATDGLTGISNRRHFDGMLLTEWRRATRNELPLAVMMLDVDRFKRFNDQYGHPAGDECLQKVASTISATIRRPGDVAARYGGEEFAVILPETDLSGAFEVAERVRNAVQALAIPHLGNEAGVVTISIGVASMAPQPDAATPASALVSAADTALYEAKKRGRNQVSWTAGVEAQEQFSLSAMFSANRDKAGEKGQD